MAGLAAVIALAASIALPATVFAWDPNSFSPADEQLLVTLTNQARAAAGLPALTVDPVLTDMARWRARDMIDKNYFSHSIPPDGRQVFDYLTAAGYCYKVAGENLWADWVKRMEGKGRPDARKVLDATLQMLK